MIRIRPLAFALSPVLAATMFAGPIEAADIVTRTPNIQSVQLPAPGTALFMFNHRMANISAITSSPTFLIDTGLVPRLSLYVQYATTAHDLSAAGVMPVSGSHDAGLGLREAILRQSDGAPLSMTLSEGLATAGLYGSSSTLPAASWYSLGLYTNSPEAGAQLELARNFWPLGLVGIVRAVGYRYAVVGNKLYNQGNFGYRPSAAIGATVAINKYLALSGDYGKYLDGLNEVPAWSAGLQGNIPFTPHMLAIEVSNVPSTTMGGVSEPAPGQLYVGFSFSILFNDLGRWARLVTPSWPKAQPTSVAPAPSASGATPSASASAGAAAPNPALYAQGKKLFLETEDCAACHGPNAAGTDMAPRIVGKTAADIKHAIATVPPMSGFSSLTSSDRDAIAAYLQDPRP